MVLREKVTSLTCGAQVQQHYVKCRVSAVRDHTRSHVSNVAPILTHDQDSIDLARTNSRMTVQSNIIGRCADTLYPVFLPCSPHIPVMSEDLAPGGISKFTRSNAVSQIR